MCSLDLVHTLSWTPAHSYHFRFKGYHSHDAILFHAHNSSTLLNWKMNSNNRNCEMSRLSLLAGVAFSGSWLVLCADVEFLDRMCSVYTPEPVRCLSSSFQLHLVISPFVIVYFFSRHMSHLDPTAEKVDVIYLNQLISVL